MEACLTGIERDPHLGVGKGEKKFDGLKIRCPQVGCGDDPQLTIPGKGFQLILDNADTAPFDKRNQHIHPVGMKYFLLELGNQGGITGCGREQSPHGQWGFRSGRIGKGRIKDL